MIAYDRLVAPREHLGVLIEPAPAEILDFVNHPLTDALDRISILNRPLAAWRADLRRHLKINAPVIATGHQAEFFHAGVFAKIIAADVIATRTGAAPLYITVDSDIGKTHRLVVPEIAARGLRQVDVLVPGLNALRADECQPDVPRRQWLDFFVRVASIYEHYEASLLKPFSQAWLAGDAAEVNYCDGLARGYAGIEESLGFKPAGELRISNLSATPEFRAFAAHLILNAKRLAADYNSARDEFRRRHGVTNQARPVPPLATDAGRSELPLWVFRCDGPRARLLVRRAGERIELFANAEHIGEIPAGRLADPAAHDSPWPIERDGWRLRPRALTLSAFVRLFLADLFIHGIGGAKYDEVTDDYLARFLGTPPPPICCISATVYLPLPRTGVRLEDVRQARQRTRDLRFNPQRHLQNLPEPLIQQRARLVRRSRELGAHDYRDHAARRAAFAEIRDINEQMLRLDPWRAAEFEQQVHDLEHRLQQDEIALNREYFVGLHLKPTMQELAIRIARRFGMDQI